MFKVRVLRPIKKKKYWKLPIDSIAFSKIKAKALTRFFDYFHELHYYNFSNAWYSALFHAVFWSEIAICSKFGKVRNNLHTFSSYSAIIISSLDFSIQNSFNRKLFGNKSTVASVALFEYLFSMTTLLKGNNLWYLIIVEAKYLILYWFYTFIFFAEIF